MLQPDEQQALKRIATEKEAGTKDLEEAVTHLEQLGLIGQKNGIPIISAELLYDWVRGNAA
jgi:hypothetical protein